MKDKGEDYEEWREMSNLVPGMSHRKVCVCVCVRVCVCVISACGSLNLLSEVDSLMIGNI